MVDVQKRFLYGHLDSGEIQRDLTAVLEGVARFTQVSSLEIRQSLVRALQSGAWQIRGALSSETLPEERFHGIMYDAFSSKTSPALWSEDFLGAFFAHCADENALVSTYACTGNLKRSLKANGFTLSDRSGFQGKRSATLGRRGLFSFPPGP